MDPWPHMVVDDYFEQSYFDNMFYELDNYDYSDVFVESKKRAMFWDDRLVDEFPMASLCSKTNEIDDDLCRVLNCDREYDVLRNNLTMSYPNIRTGKIHTDKIEKVVSIVVYVYPETSYGTLIYNEKKELVTEVQWKPNRALIFCPRQKVTFHAANIDPDTIRVIMKREALDSRVWRRKN
jgi:hypothetical protein